MRGSLNTYARPLGSTLTRRFPPQPEPVHWQNAPVRTSDTGGNPDMLSRVRMPSRRARCPAPSRALARRGRSTIPAPRAPSPRRTNPRLPSSLQMRSGSLLAFGLSADGLLRSCFPGSYCCKRSGCERGRETPHTYRTRADNTEALAATRRGCLAAPPVIQSERIVPASVAFSGSPAGRRGPRGRRRQARPPEGPVPGITLPPG